ncbi:hypothetical protein D9M68_176650 [compost metagenome]
MAVQIEQTSKRYKGRMLIGVLLCCIGVVMAMASESSLWGVIVIVVGLITYFAARFGAWWNHG